MQDEFQKHARVLIVDDEPANVRYLEDVLRWAGYEHLEAVTEPKKVLPTVRFFEPDLVILDLLMPEMDGFQVLEELQEELGSGEGGECLPILVLTADASRDARRRALEMGARDFLTKPMSPTEVRLRVGNLLETRFLYLRCRRQEARLEDLERTAADGGDGEREVLERWADVLDLRRGERQGSARRVARLTARIARAMGASETDVERLRRASLLHDLALPNGRGRNGRGEPGGKGGERAEVVARLLGGVRSPVLQTAHDILVEREERWDGKGPRGLAGDAIPLAARIVAVARAAIALASEDEDLAAAGVLEALEDESGSRFDPQVVEALLGSHAASAA